MPSARRRFSAGITQSLLEEPYRYGYFQAVRLLERTEGDIARAVELSGR